MPAQARILTLVKELDRTPERKNSEPSQSPFRWLRGLGRGALLLVSLLALVISFRDVSLHAIQALLGGLGFRVLWVLLPWLSAILVETWAWQSTFAALSTRPPFLPLFRVRIVTESLGSVLPLGPLWSEAIKPHLLARHCGLPLPVSLTGMIIRKYMLLCSQGLYLVLGFLLGRAALEAGCARALGSPSLAMTAWIVGVVLVLLAEALARILAGGTTAQRLFQLVLELPNSRLRSALQSFQQQIAQTDGYALRFFREAKVTRLSGVGLSLGVWLLEATETWLILKVLGTPLDWGNAVGIEAVVVLLRHLLFMLPAGLGAQELGYTVLLGALGVNVETSAAFAVIKRLRELSWVLVGYLLLVADTKGAAARVATAIPQPTLNSSGGE